METATCPDHPSKSLWSRFSSVVGERVCFQSGFFQNLAGGRGDGGRFDYAHCGRKLCGGEEKNCENGAHHRGVLIIINRRTYCFGCPSRRRSVSRAVVGVKLLLYYVIKTGNLTAANGKSPSASNYYYRV